MAGKQTVAALYDALVAELVAAGLASPYRADANETDPRYLSYGVRAPQTKQLIRAYRGRFRALAAAEQRELAYRLIASKVGEQQTVALAILEPQAAYFTPDTLPELDQIVRSLHGWSKVDAYTGSLLRDVLLNYPRPMLALAHQWNNDADRWLRRTSVVLFTRKIARSGQFNDAALALCDNLITDSELLVQKGVGWSLKDMRQSEPERIVAYLKQLHKRGDARVIVRYALKNMTAAERADVLANMPEKADGHAHIR